MNDWEPKSNGSPEGDAFVAVWARIMREQRLQLETWIWRRIEMGYAAAHPDDGWVNRDEKSIGFQYPQFLLPHKMAPGALVALGDPENWRPVQLVKKSHTLVVSGKRDMERWYFSEMPEHPQPTFLQRVFQSFAGRDQHIWVHRRGQPFQYCEFCRAERPQPSWY